MIRPAPRRTLVAVACACACAMLLPADRTGARGVGNRAESRAPAMATRSSQSAAMRKRPPAARGPKTARDAAAPGSSIAIGDTLVVFGPVVHAGGATPWVAHADSFTAAAVAAGGRAVLRIENGDAGGANRVAGVIVNLGGAQVVGSAEVDRSVSAIARDVPLAAGNGLRLWVNGTASEHVTVSVLVVPDSGYAVFGPQTFARGGGAPEIAAATFDLPAGLGPPYRIVVKNGHADARARVSDALVRMNGATAVESHELGPGVASLARPVSLTAHNRIEVRLVGAAGSEVSVRVIASDPAPPVLTVSAPNDGAHVVTETVQVTGTVADATPVTVTVNGAPVSVANGAFDAAVPVALGSNLLTVVATDAVGRTTTITRTVVREPAPPTLVAPPLDSLFVTPFLGLTAFLYSGANPIQTGVTPGTIVAQRVAVVRGRVLGRDGSPLPNVQVSILNHPELGQTLSRADGAFDLAVNGGGPMVVAYAKSGWLPAQRQAVVPYRDYVTIEDVALVPLDPAVTPIDFAAPIEVARGSVVSDTHGVRRATMMFDQGTAATLVMPNGSTQPLASMHVRATEYTVGPNGETAMPATLPPSSMYTYCVELSADEAIAAGARSITFTKPVSLYLENFVGFPLGFPLPFGTYDPVAATWCAETDGRVICVVDTAGGIAAVDATGDSVADGAATLDSMGISIADRAQLAALYPPGRSLWHVETSHFSPSDINGSFTWPADFLTQFLDIAYKFWKNLIDPDCQEGSIIECQNQVLGERLPVVGTPYSLNYRSARVRGDRTTRMVEVPISTDYVPPSVEKILLELHVAGREYRYEYPPLPNQTKLVEWDGLDIYGRPVPGAQPALIRVGFVYPRIFAVATGSGGGGGGGAVSSGRGFGRPANRGIIMNRTVPGLTHGIDWYDQRISLGSLENRAAGLGSWSLDVHHAYDPLQGGYIYRGDGERLNPELLTPVIFGLYPNGGAATDFVLRPDGSMFVLKQPGQFQDTRVYLRQPDGTETIYAGNANPSIGFGYGGDGGPATQATLNEPGMIALGPDGITLYIADTDNSILRKVDTNGIITTVAGIPQNYSCSGSDGLLGTQWTFNGVYKVEAAEDGTVYFTSNCPGLFRLDPDGRVMKVPGALPSPYDKTLAMGPDGSVYYGKNTQVRRALPDGTDVLVAGDGSFGNGGDGLPATSAQLTFTSGLTVGPDGSVYIATGSRIRKVGPDGIITTIAGGGTMSFGSAAAATAVPGVGRMKINPEGDLLFTFNNGPTFVGIAKMRPLGVGFSLSEVLRASPDGNELYVFDVTGKHLRTLNALTAKVIYRFAYGADRQLATITDADGNVTTIQRNGAGEPTAIVGPYGHRTTLDLDANGYLSRVVDPAGSVVELTAGSAGLLTGLRDPRGYAHAFQYDGYGRLYRDDGPAGGSQQLTRTGSTTDFTVTRTTAEGRTSTYAVEQLPNGAVRRTVTGADLHATAATTGLDQVTSTQSPEGMSSVLAQGPDPRYGMQSPLISSQSVATPGGRTATITGRRLHLTGGGVAGDNSITDEIRVNGRLYQGEYTAATRTLVERTPLGRTMTTTMDSVGRPVSLAIPGLATMQLHYDGHGRLDRTQEGGRIWQLAYDDSGRLAQITDPLLRVTDFRYEASDRLIRETLPGGRTISFAYDSSGNLKALRPPSKPVHGFEATAVNLTDRYTPPTAGLADFETRWTYDRDRRLRRLDRPDSSNARFGYDAAGRLLSVTEPRGVTSYTYHPTTGLLNGLSSPDSVFLVFGYDGGVPLSESWTGAITGNVARVYDNEFRVQSQTVNGGNSVSFGYDNDGLLTGAGALVMTRHAQNGFLTGTTLGQVTTRYEYTSSAEPKLDEARYAGNVLFTQSAERDSLGRITRITETIQDTTVVKDYSYDGAGRLYEVRENSSLKEHYEYDPNGNRLVFQGGASTDTATASYDDQDRLRRYGNALYLYTAGGDLAFKITGSDTTRYTYDALGRLVTVVLPSHDRIDYLIDGQGRRVGRKLNGVLRTTWLYQNGLDVIAELDSVGNVVARFVYGARAHVPEYLVKSGATYRLITDLVGSVRLAVNTTTGEVAQRVDFDAYGVLRRDSNPTFQPLAFAAGLSDRSTGLVRFGARDYEPISGRWTARDPIDFLGLESNLYTYASNRPHQRSDPTGLLSDEDFSYRLPPSSGASDPYEQSAFDQILSAIPSPPQDVVDALAGYGDELLFYLPRGIRGAQGIDVVNPCSDAYSVGAFYGFVTQALLIKAGTKPGGFLNRGRNLRIGFGQHGGNRVFRVAGEWLERWFKTKHFDIWRGGPI
jgi:RHS repeat-associated protein